MPSFMLFAFALGGVIGVALVMGGALIIDNWRWKRSQRRRDENMRRAMAVGTTTKEQP